jgi:hypothetical protein
MTHSPDYESSVIEFNDYAEGKGAEIVFNDEHFISATDLYLNDDTLHWSDPETKLENGIVISDVTKVIFIKNLFTRGIDGTQKGVIGGAVAGLLLAGLINEAETAVPQDLLAYLYLPILGAVSGAVIGFPLGLIFANNQKYEFQTNSKNDDGKNSTTNNF